MLHRLQNTEWVVPEDILNIFLGQPPLHQAVSQAGVAFNPGKADSKAGASIQITAQAEKYPQYGFDIHKGYGTRAHYAALEQYGACPLHRMSFLKKFYEQK